MAIYDFVDKNIAGKLHFLIQYLVEFLATYVPFRKMMFQYKFINISSFLSHFLLMQFFLKFNKSLGVSLHLSNDSETNDDPFLLIVKQRN